MPRIKIDTKKIISFYKPIELEIDGIVYIYDKPVTTNFMIELNSLAILAEKNRDIDAAAKQLVMVTNMPVKQARKFDLRVIQEIIIQFGLAVAKMERKEGEIEKKVEDSGNKKLQK